jgi:hypothetical protein
MKSSPVPSLFTSFNMMIARLNGLQLCMILGDPAYSQISFVDIRSRQRIVSRRILCIRNDKIGLVYHD